MKQFVRLALPLCLLPAAAIAATPGAGPTARPQTHSQSLGQAGSEPQVFVYQIVRNGSQIGEHDVTITTTPQGTTVDATTDIDVKVLFVSAYSFHATSREIWNGDRFISFKSQTNDNGKRHSVTASADAKGVSILADGHRQSLPTGTIPASFWTAKHLQHTQLFDTDTGAPLEVKATDMGPAPVKIGAHQITTDHYKISGSIDRDIWFMQSGTPVRFQLKGSDNSTIASELMPEGTQPAPRPATEAPGTR